MTKYRTPRCIFTRLILGESYCFSYQKTLRVEIPGVFENTLKISKLRAPRCILWRLIPGESYCFSYQETLRAEILGVCGTIQDFCVFDLWPRLF